MHIPASWGVPGPLCPLEKTSPFLQDMCISCCFPPGGRTPNWCCTVLNVCVHCSVFAYYCTGLNNHWPLCHQTDALVYSTHWWHLMMCSGVDCVMEKDTNWRTWRLTVREVSNSELLTWPVASTSVYTHPNSGCLAWVLIACRDVLVLPAPCLPACAPSVKPCMLLVAAYTSASASSLTTTSVITS